MGNSLKTKIIKAIINGTIAHPTKINCCENKQSSHLNDVSCRQYFDAIKILKIPNDCKTKKKV